MDVDLSLGDAVRLGVLERRWKSARARSKELRGCKAAVGERGVEMTDVCGCRTFVLENDMERSEVGVDSSMTGGVVCA